MNSPTGRPPLRRSCLAVPASSPRKLAKAGTLPADELVIDLEDSVAVIAKDDARMAAVKALRDRGSQSISVRVNQTRSKWCHLDLIAVASSSTRPEAVIVPKVESAGDIEFVERLLDGVEGKRREPRGIGIQALIETPAGLANADEIAHSSPRLKALILGYADLAATLGRPLDATGNLDLWLPAQHSVLVAARRYGIQAIDGPHLELAVDDRFVAAATRARDLGFDGKWAIHPSQLVTLNEIFSPTSVEVEHARAVLQALQRSEQEGGDGAVALDGQMIDEAVRRSAEHVLWRAGELGAIDE